MKDVAIVGAGGLGRETLLVIDQINQIKDQWRFIGFFDEDLEVGIEVDRSNVLGGLVELNQWPGELAVVIAIADPHAKLKVTSSIHNNLISFTHLIHPTVVCGKLKGSCSGLIIGANCSLTTNVNIGSHVIINLNCTIGHDSTIEDYCSIMPGSNISGNVTIKKSSYIGTGVQILPGITIGENVVVGAGAVVTKDVSSDQVVAGVPARRIK